MNNRYFMLLVLILVMTGYVAYRYFHQFFARKSAVANLVMEHATQGDEERTRIENMIRTNLQQERDNRTDDISRLTDRSRRMEARLQELCDMLDEDDDDGPIPGAPSSSDVQIAPAQNE